MKLKLISLIPVFIGLIVFFSISALMQNYIIKPTFNELQKNRAFEDAGRVTEAIDREFFHLGNLTSDWAEWDDTYHFVNGQNPGFIKTNIDWISLERGAKINLISVYNKEGNLFFSSAFDSDLGGNLTIKEFMNFDEQVKRLVNTSILKETPLKGFYQTNYGLMMICINPILTTQSTGPVAGALVFGRFFKNTVIESLKEQVKVNSDFLLINQLKLNEYENKLINQIHLKEKKYVEYPKINQEFVYEKINDLNNNPAILLKTPVRADIKETGLSTGRSLMGWLGLAALISLITVSIFNFKIRDLLGKQTGLKKNKAFQIAVTAFTIVIVATILLFFEFKSLNEKDSVNRFNSKANIQKNIVENSLKETLISLNFIKSFFESSQLVSRDEFFNFTNSILKDEIVKNLYWVEYQPQSNPSSEVYNIDYKLSLRYANPSHLVFKENYDFSQDQILNPIILKVRDSNYPYIFDNVTILNKNQNEYLLFVPVYSSNNTFSLQEKRSSFKGTLIGVININKIFSSALSVYALNDLTISINDISQPKSPVELFSNRQSDFRMNEFWSSRLKSSKEIDFAGKVWQIIIEPNEIYAKSLINRNYTFLFLIGFIIALLLALYLYNINTYRLTAEYMVKLKTAQLQESEELYRTQIELSPDSVFMVDLSSNILTVNRKGKEMLGYSSFETLDKLNFRSLIMTDNLLTYDIYLEECINNRSVEMFEVKLQKKDQTQIPVEIGIAVWTDVQNRVKALIFTVRDISQRIQAEIERLELERKMLHTQKLESLGVMAGGIAHDFNNLLMAIIGNLDIVLPLISKNSPVADKINKALNASKRAVDLTKQMLAYSGKGQFVIKPVNLSNLMMENAEIFKAAINKNVTFDLDLEKNIPYIKADEGQCQQIIMNLITNASEAIGENSGKVVLKTGMMNADEFYLNKSRLDEKCQPGTFVWIEVSDNGCGMDVYTINRMFEPFFTTKFTGRGLGMSALLGIVKAHQGAIIIDSEPGIGTVIRVLFPALSQEESLKYEESGNEIDMRQNNPVKGDYVLVVDDEDMVREICKDMLTLLGYKVFSASDAQEAVDIYTSHPGEILCVLMDLMMPGKDVTEAFKEIIEFDSEAKIILSSGYNEYEAMKQFNQKGLSGFIEKPYQLAKLKKLFLQLFDIQ